MVSDAMKGTCCSGGPGEVKVETGGRPRKDFSKKGRGGQAQAEETSISPSSGMARGVDKEQADEAGVPGTAAGEQGRALEPDQGGFHGPS